MKKIFMICLIVFLGTTIVNAQKTLKVLVVRHAEKLTDDPKEKDPDLSVEGKERAEALMKYIGGQRLDSIFSTNYKRTKLTAYPVADKNGISIKTYNPTEQKVLAKQLIANAKGQKILIVGHSNTVLEMIEAFGGKRPVKELTDDDYDYIFTLTIKGDKVDVKSDHYGVEHHSVKSNEAKEMKTGN